MRLKPWLAAIGIAAVGYGSVAQAGLFDRLRERAEERQEAKEEARAAREAAERGPALGLAPRPLGPANQSPFSFAVANDEEIGRYVRPAAHQSLPAPGVLDGPLRPIPEPSFSSPSPSQSFYPPAPGGPYAFEGGPAPPFPIETYPGAGPTYPVGPAEGFPLYHRVKYEDLDNVHPCAVTMIVQVLDPCEDRCASCGPRCVFIQICVPPNERPRIKVEDRGREVKYKFSNDYEIEIESEDGVVTVNYDD